MAMSFSRSDPGAPAQVADASFSTSRRGFDQTEVRDFLQMVAAEMSRLTERVRFLEREVEAAQTSPEVSARLDEETLTRLLGEETARVLSAARSSAAEIREKAEQSAAQLVSEASDEAARVREEVEVEASRRRADAAADAEAELEMAKQQGREMVNEARAYRERVLSELSRRRELAREQIEQLVHGRDRLVAAFERARVAAVDVMADIQPLGEPDEYVDLTPTTGPVPVMVARDAATTTAADVVEDAPPTDEADGDEAPVDAGADIDVDPDDEQGGEVVELATATDETVADVDEFDADDPDAEFEAVPDDVEADADEAVPDDVEAATDEVATESRDADHDAGEDADVVVDLFARLRSATVDDTDGAAASEAVEMLETDDADAVLDDAADDGTAETARADVEQPATAQEQVLGDQTEPTADHDTEIDEADDPFARRDAELTPLIVGAARKLKRVLADEQNDVLDALRRTASVTSLDDLLPASAEQGARYTDAVADDLLLGAQAGAAATDGESVVTLGRTDARRCVAVAGEQLAERLVGPLRDRLDRAVSDSGGESDVLTKKVRAVYREVKTRHIDDVLDDVVRTAHGAGVSAAIGDGDPVLWTVDTRHPACPDCDDNALSPAVAHGDPFPTGHTTAPAHPGCRCMLLLVRPEA